MDPASRRPLGAALLAAWMLFSALAPPTHAHGGGGGHGGGGAGGGGRGPSGSHSAGSGHGSGLFGLPRGYVPNPSSGVPSGVGWPSFPEDLPFARLHRYLSQHRPHRHVGPLAHQ